ncbi:MAG TPA: type III secretion system chaperone [Candidatus Avidesulfovibrio excrementigallinarum]|nr:type III secretion system chaperone [Candidatus Avidesulfovibrio excrementigallinarum]
MSLSTLNALLAEALAVAGLPSAALNASGMAEINVHGLAVALEYMEADDRLVLYCSVGRLPAEVAPEIYEFLLEADLFGAKLGGGHIGLYGPARTLLFSFSLPLSGLNAAQLGNALQRFAERASALMNEIEERLAGSAGTTDMTPFMGAMLWV